MDILPKSEISNFEKWLNAQDKAFTVGWGRSPCNCPIARYLVETRKEFKSVYIYGGGSAAVTEKFWFIDVNKSYDLPLWMKLFIKQLDRKYDISHNVTAQEALDIVGTIPGLRDAFNDKR